MIRSRYATAADIDRFYGARPYQTLRAVIVTLDDEPVCVIGLARQDSYAQLFSEFRPHFRPHLKSMTTLRALKRVMAMVEGSKLPVYALADEEEPDSVRLLTRMGFVHDNERVYRWQP